MKFIRRIKEFFWAMRYIQRHAYDRPINQKGYFDTKKELLDFISKSIGNDWKDLESFELNHGFMKIIYFKATR